MKKITDFLSKNFEFACNAKSRTADKFIQQIID